MIDMGFFKPRKLKTKNSSPRGEIAIIDAAMIKKITIVLNNEITRSPFEKDYFLPPNNTALTAFVNIGDKERALPI
jgi:hypothetical protein